MKWFLVRFAKQQHLGDSEEVILTVYLCFYQLVELEDIFHFIIADSACDRLLPKSYRFLGFPAYYF